MNTISKNNKISEIQKNARQSLPGVAEFLTLPVTLVFAHIRRCQTIAVAWH